MSSDEKKTPRCPKCAGGDVKAIVFGYPTEETMESAGAGEIELGGCIVSEQSPDWRCSSCGHSWADPKLPKPWKR